MDKKLPKISHEELRKQLETARKEYEDVIHDQRERIVKLRDENTELSKQIESYKKYADQIVSALVDARLKANDIIQNANSRAAEIIKSAEDAKKASEKTILYYRSSLKDLERRSERILVSIQNELSRDKTPSLSIVSQ